MSGKKIPSSSVQIQAPANMVSFLLVTLMLLSLKGHTLDFPTDLQPGINPVPSLPGNYSKDPDYWEHATPLLQSPKIPEFPPQVRIRASGSWAGWGDVSYLFSL